MASCCMSLPSQAVRSRSASAQDMKLCTSRLATGWNMAAASVGVTKLKPGRESRTSGRASMNWKMPVDSHWCSPKVS